VRWGSQWALCTPNDGVRYRINSLGPIGDGEIGGDPSVPIIPASVSAIFAKDAGPLLPANRLRAITVDVSGDTSDWKPVEPARADFIIESERWRCARKLPVLVIDEVKRFDLSFARVLGRQSSEMGATTPALP
jgi:hypothetical protein